MATTPDDRLRVSVLGPVRAWRGPKELPLGPARQRVLFVLLAAAAGRDVGRDELIAGIWGTSAPTTAVGSVYTYISGLRRGLGHESLTSGPAGYALRLHPGDIDSERFVALCAEAARLRRGGDPSAAVTRLDEALGMWHGEAYAGLTGHRIEVERAQLAQRRLDAVEQRARMLVELGDDGVLADLAGLVRDHPLHEPFYELLMLALHRTGRRTEALALFRTAQHTLLTELGVEPGDALTRLHEKVSARPAETIARRPPAAPPDPVRRPTRDRPPPGSLAGRDGELHRLRTLVEAVVAGQGTVVWVDGEPGIGKTALLTAAFADAAERGCQVAWGVAQELDQQVPLQAAARALGLQTRLTAGPAALGRQPTGLDDPVDGTADRVLAQVRAACATAPLLLVLDGLHRADQSGVSLWERLVAATRRMPLLLVAAARLEPGEPELVSLRRGVQARQGHLLRLTALPPEAVGELVTGLVGAPLGPHLAKVVPISAGNPSYARELTIALLRRGEVRLVDGLADIPDAVPIEAPRSLLAVVRATMDLLSAGTQEVLRTAALLGTRFSIDDVGAVTGHSPFHLVSSLEEALEANVVVDDGTELAFRHPILRHVLYESIPPPARSTLHRHTAEVLANGGSPVGRVAEQLAAATAVVDDWVVSWLVAHHAELGRRASQLGSDLLRRVLGTDLPDPQQRERLLIALVRLDFRDQRQPLDEAREVLRIATDPAARAEMRHLLAAMTYRVGDTAAALGLVQDALTDPTVPALWHTRHRMLLANFRRGPLDDLDQADRTAAGIHAAAPDPDDPYEAAFALQTTWLTSSIRRDHQRALEYVDRALDIMRENPAFAGLYLDLLDNRVFTLQNLDRLEDAERTLREAALFALRHRLPASLYVAAVVQHYWSGRWDDVFSVVSAVTDDPPGTTLLGTREPGATAMLLHGTAALVAARREDVVLATGHLDAAELVPATDAERESCDFLLVARSLVAEQQGRAEDALRILDPLLVPEYAPLMIRHQWLPDVTRLALSLGRRDVAERAAATCADEAARESRPARAHPAAARCHALLDGDPEPALAAAAHYREVGRVTELAAALEDAAALLAAARRPHEAARIGGEAVGLYTLLGARWDLRRAHRRLTGYGVDPARGDPPTDRGVQRTSISYRE